MTFLSTIPSKKPDIQILNKCSRCDHKLYGQTFMSENGWWYASGRCWYCVDSKAIPWDNENWIPIVIDGLIMIVEESGS